MATKAFRPLEAKAPSVKQRGKAFAGRHRLARIAKFQAAQRKKKLRGKSR